MKAKTMSKSRKFASVQRTVFLDEFGREHHIIDAIDEDGVAWCLRDPGESDWHKLHPLPDKREEE